jgi:hypothetical protein
MFNERMTECGTVVSEKKIAQRQRMVIRIIITAGTYEVVFTAAIQKKNT